MAGAWTTMTVLDGGGTSRTMRVWDESGGGTGPFTFAQLASNQTGTGGELALETGNLATLAGAVSASKVQVVENIGGSLVSSTNGLYTNLLQSNGTLTPTNGVWANVMFNNAIVSASVGLPVNIVAGTITATNVTASINQGGSAVSSTNGAYFNVLFNNALVSASVGLPVNLLTYAALTAVISGTTFISGGNITAVVSGTTTITAGNVTAAINQGGSALSSTNGVYTNLLQQNATLSPTNGIFANVMFNNAIVSASVGLPVNLLTYAALTAVISGTAFISGGNVTAVVSGTTALNQGGSALSATNGIYANVLLGNAAISSTNPMMVEGDTASGVADANNPVKIGGLAKTGNPTGVADGQRVAALFDILGKQIIAGSIRSLKAQFNSNLVATTSEVTLLPAISSVFMDIYGCILANQSASACSVSLKDSTGGTTRIFFEVPAGDTRGFMLPESGGFPQTAQNNSWTVTLGAAISTMTVSILYIKNITA